MVKQLEVAGAQSKPEHKSSSSVRTQVARRTSHHSLRKFQKNQKSKNQKAKKKRKEKIPPPRTQPPSTPTRPRPCEGRCPRNFALVPAPHRLRDTAPLPLHQHCRSVAVAAAAAPTADSGAMINHVIAAACSNVTKHTHNTLHVGFSLSRFLALPRRGLRNPQGVTKPFLNIF